MKNGRRHMLSSEDFGCLYDLRSSPRQEHATHLIFIYKQSFKIYPCASLPLFSVSHADSFVKIPTPVAETTASSSPPGREILAGLPKPRYVSLA